MLGAMVFGHFLPKQKVARSPLRRAEPDWSATYLRVKQMDWFATSCGSPFGPSATPMFATASCLRSRVRPFRPPRN